MAGESFSVGPSGSEFQVDSSGNATVNGTLTTTGAITGDLTGDVTGAVTGTDISVSQQVTISADSAAENAFTGTQGVPVWRKFTVAFDDTTVDGYTVPTGKVAQIHDAYVDVTTAYDGSGHDLDVGVVGNTNAIIDGSAASIDLTDASPQLTGQDQKGAGLWDSVEKASKVLHAVAATVVRVTNTQGTATQGAVDVYVLISEMDA